MSEEGALRSVKHAADTALELAELAAGDLEANCFSLVSAAWPEDFVFRRQKVADFGFGVKVKIVNDASSALHAGTEGGGVFTSGTVHFGKSRGAVPS